MPEAIRLIRQVRHSVSVVRDAPEVYEGLANERRERSVSDTRRAVVVARHTIVVMRQVHGGQRCEGSTQVVPSRFDPGGWVHPLKIKDILLHLGNDVLLHGVPALVHLAVGA